MTTESTSTDPKSTSPKGEKASEKKAGAPTAAKKYTEADILKAVNDAKAKAGFELARERKRADAAEDALGSITQRLEELEGRAREAELAEARGDPEALRAFQLKESASKELKALRVAQAELKREQEELQASKEAHEAEIRSSRVAAIAARHGLEISILEDLNITDAETLEKIAVGFAAAKPKTPEGTEAGSAFSEEFSAEEEAFVPDSGETTGSGQPTMDQLEKMPMVQYAQHVAKRDGK